MKRNKLTAASRLYECPIPIIAITGGIGTGKSTVMNILSKMGHHCLSADQLIKNIYQKDELQSILLKNAPEVLDKKKINFNKLRKKYFENKTLEKKLNTVLFRLLPLEFNSQLKPHWKNLFYEVPLLFEKELQTKVDTHICIYISEKQQIERAKNRDHNAGKVLEIIHRQMPLSKKVGLFLGPLFFLIIIRELPFI